MSCCLPGSAPENRQLETGFGPSQQEILLASHSVGEGLQQTEISVPTIHCGGCIRIIEQGLGSLPGIARARVNLSTKRVTVQWQEASPPPLFATLDRLGYPAHLHDPGEDAKDPVLIELLRALAISGFAAGNVMLFSMSIWAGADATSRDLFHWLSALVSLPAAAYSGQVFFRSAWQALRYGQTNMDVPISIGVLLAFGMSMYDTVTHGEYAYFDAAISLLFFLLIGRVLDHMMRERARQAVKGLARMAARGAVVRRADGSHDYLPVNELQPGMQIILAAGERVPVDGRVIAGTSDIDCALVNGESLPQAAGIDTELQAGTLNLTAPLTMQATATAQNSFLAEMLRLMEAAESGRAGYRRIADRAAQLYAPVVHIAAFVSFLGWMLAMGDLHRALTIAVAVLIITCPCALALAVPMVQVVAARRLFEAGIMVKDGAALERLDQIDTVVFDKTGTLTLGQLALTNRAEIDPQHLAIAAAMAVHSRHPQSRALSAAAPSAALPFSRIEEYPGLGLEAEALGSVYRLGRVGWALGYDDNTAGTVLVKDGMQLATFRFDDRLRSDAQGVVARLQQRGLRVEILSGDRPEVVAAIARQLGVTDYRAAMLPGGKAARLAALAAEGRKVLMVGDGLNDAPALSTAHASMAPASAADIGRNAADFVFLRDSLLAVLQAMDVARQAGKLIRQNFVLSVGYNAIALPFAIAGYITPLIAALVMSSSSIIVVGNALRLNPLPGKQPASQGNLPAALPEGAE